MPTRNRIFECTKKCNFFVCFKLLVGKMLITFKSIFQCSAFSIHIGEVISRFNKIVRMKITSTLHNIFPGTCSMVDRMLDKRVVL